jgi:hypothetical protein
MLGKAEQADFLNSSLFQAVAQVNLTALNTFLLGPHFSSFFAHSFIHVASPLLAPACRLLSALFLFQ